MLVTNFHRLKDSYFSGVPDIPSLCSTLRSMLTSYFDLSERVSIEMLQGIKKNLRDSFEIKEAEGIINNKDR